MTRFVAHVAIYCLTVAHFSHGQVEGIQPTLSLWRHRKVTLDEGQLWAMLSSRTSHGLRTSTWLMMTSEVWPPKISQTSSNTRRYSLTVTTSCVDVYMSISMGLSIYMGHFT